MSLEDILRQKAANKEAERLRQDEEERIAVAEAERLQGQEAEEARLGGLRQSAAGIDARIGQIHSLLTELAEAHEQAGVSVAEAKREKEELTKATAKMERLFANEEFRTIFAEEGIESVDDLLKAEEYAEHEEVQSVKKLRQSRAEKRETAREQIRARGNIKSEAHKTITAEAPDVPRRRTYKDITATLEDRIRELEAERKMVFSQTPEGQEALKKEIFDTIAKRHERFNTSVSFPLTSKENIHNRQLVMRYDIEDAKEYGEERVKAAIKKYYGGVIEERLAEDAKGEGFSELQEAVETIENLPKRWWGMKETLRELQGVRHATINRLAELLGNDAKAPLFQALNYYGRYRLNDPQKLAEAFLNDRAARNSIGFFNTQSETPEMVIEKIISEQEDSLINTKKAFPEKNIREDPYSAKSQRYTTGLRNPEKLAIVLAEQLEFYRKFQAALTTPEEVVQENLLEKIHIRSPYDVKWNETPSFIEFDGKTYARLRDTSLPNIKYILKSKQEAMEKTSAALKEQIGNKVEVNWALEEMSAFKQNREYSRIIGEAERIIRMQNIAENISFRLDAAAAELKGQIEERVHFTEGGALRFDAASEEELRRLYKEVDSAQKGIDKIEKDIHAIDERARWEKDGLFGGKKKRREKEKADLKIKEKVAREWLKNAKAEYEPKNKMDEKLGAIRSLLHNAERQEIALVPPRDYAGSLKGLIDTIKGQMNFQLTPEQSQVYEQYQALKKKEEETAERYKKWRR